MGARAPGRRVACATFTGRNAHRITENPGKTVNGSTTGTGRQPTFRR